MFCGSWDTGAREKSRNLSSLNRRGFRGDSRWIGIDVVGAKDTLVGLTETLNFYILQEPYLMTSAAAEKSSEAAGGGEDLAVC